MEKSAKHHSLNLNLSCNNIQHFISNFIPTLCTYFLGHWKELTSCMITLQMFLPKKFEKAKKFISFCVYWVQYTTSVKIHFMDLIQDKWISTHTYHIFIYAVLDLQCCNIRKRCNFEYWQWLHQRLRSKYLEFFWMDLPQITTPKWA